jgi:protein-tyrosine phosphatase
MQDRLKTDFRRYFFMGATAFRLGMPSIMPMFGGNRSTDRSDVSEIIKGRIYLANLPMTTKFQEKMNLQNNPNAGLVVSCLDIRELAYSQLLLEPNAEKIKYHVLAMQNCTANVDTPRHIIDTLILMSEFADSKKPILIHCRSGVGRSAMMTALHICHRYLLNDEVIRAEIDSKTQLNPASENFIETLYKTVAGYVFSKRSCCQFGSERDNKAIDILSTLHDSIKLNQPLLNHDENHQFLADFVQSSEYKKLQHYYYRNAKNQSYYADSSSSSLVAAKEFSQSFLSNDNDWYQQLVSAVRNESIEENPLHQFCNSSAAGAGVAEERRDLLRGILDIIIQLAFKYPQALHGQQALTALEKEASLDGQSFRI